MKIIKISVSFSDERGQIIDLIENEMINSVTIVTFRKGAIRGNHYHSETSQWNYLLSGKIKLLSQISGEEIVETIMEKGDFVVTMPKERHVLIGLEDSELLVLTKGPRAGNQYETDTFRLDEPLFKQE
jgi:quercetin dioxygenase-like cupin family protein